MDDNFSPKVKDVITYSKEEALRILATPIEKLELSSDYYKAVFHLEKYPGPESEIALFEILKNDSDHLVN